MANIDVTLKRVIDGVGGTNIVLPTTHVGQIYSDNTLTTTLQSLLDAKISTSKIGAANGVAPLNASSKILETYLPDSFVGGLKYLGAISAATNLDTYGDLFDDPSAKGSYLIATATLSLTTGGKSTMLTPGDEGDYTFPITVEAGDWVILNNWDTDDYTWAIINNTHSNATTSAVGLVQLSSATVTTSMNGSSKVITEDVLFDTIGTSAGKIAAGDHNHSGVYQPLDTDLTKIAALLPTDGNIIVGNGTEWVTESGSTARASLGLAIGTNVQAYDATLAGIASIAPLPAGNIIYTSATDTFTSSPITALGRALIDDATASDMRTTMGVRIGTDVQAFHNNLAVLSALPYTDGNFIVGDGGAWTVESGSTVRTSLGVYSTTEVNNLLTNRPNIFYDTTAGAVLGDYIIDVD